MKYILIWKYDALYVYENYINHEPVHYYLLWLNVIDSVPMHHPVLLNGYYTHKFKGLISVL